VFKVEQSNAACHEGYYSCFFRKLEGNGLKIIGEKIFELKEIYGSRPRSLHVEDFAKQNLQTWKKRRD